MLWVVAKYLYLAAGAAVSCWLAVVVRRSWIRLDERIAAFHAEQEAGSTPPLNPYLALAELYAEAEAADRQAKARRKPQR